jgi:excisionase family DNA binding protein
MSKPSATRKTHPQPDDEPSGKAQHSQPDEEHSQPADEDPQSADEPGGMASVDELAEALGIGRNQAYEAVQSGQIPASRIGRRWLIARPIIKRIVSGELLLPPAARQA